MQPKKEAQDLNLSDRGLFQALLEIASRGLRPNSSLMEATTNPWRTNARMSLSIKVVLLLFFQATMRMGLWFGVKPGVVSIDK
jgi:hypothetical protein